MLSAIFKGNSVIFATSGLSLLAGGALGTMWCYSWQYVPSGVERWQMLWKEYRAKFPQCPSPSFTEEYSDENSILNLNDQQYLQMMAPKLPKLTCTAQVKSVRVFVPLCGASNDLQIIDDFMRNKISKESRSVDESKQYQLRVIGVDASEDAIQLFLDKLDLQEKKIDPQQMTPQEYQKEYNFKNNYSIYSIDEDVFSNIFVYKHQSYHFVHRDIFDASVPRLVLRADAIYDNQSLSVIPPNLRKDYVGILKKVAARKCKILLVTERFEEDDRVNKHAPFEYHSVDDKEEVFRLYQKLVGSESKNINLLQSIPWNADKLQKYGFPTDYNSAFTDVWFIQCDNNKF